MACRGDREYQGPTGINYFFEYIYTPIFDEFTVILTNVGDAEQTEIVTAKILTELATPFQIEQQRVDITGSIGITLYPQDGTEPETLVGNADKAMYVAKNLGRNGYSSRK